MFSNKAIVRNSGRLLTDFVFRGAADALSNASLRLLMSKLNLMRPKCVNLDISGRTLALQRASAAPRNTKSVKNCQEFLTIGLFVNILTRSERLCSKC